MLNFLREISPFNAVEPQKRYRYLIKTVIKYFVIYGVGLLLAYLATLAVRYFLGYHPFGDKKLGDNAHHLLEYYGHGFCIIVAIIFVKIESNRGVETLGITKKVGHIFVGALISLISLSVILAILFGLGQIKFNGLSSNADYFMIALFVGGFLVYSTAEEVMCRGFIETRLHSRFNINVCVWVSFFAFCLPHIPHLFEDGWKFGAVGLVNLLLISYIFSLLLDEFDNVYACSGFHAFWYILCYSVIGDNLSGTPSSTSILSFSSKFGLLTGGEFGLQASVVTTAILALLLVVLITLVNLKERKKLMKEKALGN